MESSTHKEEKKSTLTPPIPFPLSSLLLSQLQCENSEYAACRGILMYNKKTQQLTPAPFTLLPTPFPKYFLSFFSFDLTFFFAIDLVFNKLGNYAVISIF